MTDKKLHPQVLYVVEKLEKMASDIRNGNIMIESMNEGFSDKLQSLSGPVPGIKNVEFSITYTNWNSK